MIPAGIPWFDGPLLPEPPPETVPVLVTPEPVDRGPWGGA